MRNLLNKEEPGISVTQIKRFPLIVLLFFLQLGTACSPSARNLEGENWILFSAEQAEEMGIGGWAAGGGRVTEYWTPSEGDVRALEAGLASFLQENSGSFSAQGVPVWERLDEYTRQYAGIVLDGKRVIYANYFCNTAGMDWKKNFVLVMDGGECYFQLMYDPGSGAYFDLRVNGEA